MNSRPKQGNVLLAKLLVDAGADLEYIDDTEFTALLWAVESSEPEVVSLLIEAGNDLACLSNSCRQLSDS